MFVIQYIKVVLGGDPENNGILVELVVRQQPNSSNGITRRNLFWLERNSFLHKYLCVILAISTSYKATYNPRIEE